MKKSMRLISLVLSVLYAISLSGCSAALIAVIVGISASGRSGGGTTVSNAVSVVSDVEVTETKNSPAKISFKLTDQESDPVTVELFFVDPNENKRIPMNLVEKNGFGTSLERLDTTPAGVIHIRYWDFAGQVGEQFRTGNQIGVASTGVASPSLSIDADVALGNDPPQIKNVKLPNPQSGEIVGIVEIDFQIMDSSSDLVDVLVEFNLEEDLPDAGWNAARRAGSTSTSVPSLSGIGSTPEGQNFSFFWDAVNDLGTNDAKLKLRLTPNDRTVDGKATETGILNLDNNLEPVLFVNGSAFVLNPDERRGIPVPFTLIDQENDPCTVVFQWSREGEPFPEMPLKLDEVKEILADPEKRREFQIASERTLAGEGRILIDPSQTRSTSVVRLPELAREQSFILANRIDGLELEILRDDMVNAIGRTAKVFSSPIAAIPYPDGIQSIVLDSPQPGSWRLRIINPSTEDAPVELASSNSGSPDALALEAGGRSALVADSKAGTFRIVRVDFVSGKQEVLFQSDSTMEDAPVRGLLSLNPRQALVTAGRSLYRLALIQPTAKATPARLFSNLEGPWGLALDPVRREHVYIAEKDYQGQGRILAVNLVTLAHWAVPVSGVTFRQPEYLAVDRSLNRLIITATNPANGEKQIIAMRMNSGGLNAWKASKDFTGDIGNLAVGEDGLILLALKSSNSLAIGGGVEARHTIRSYEPLGQAVKLESPLPASVSTNRRWRIQTKVNPVLPKGSEAKRNFVWASDLDVPMGGNVLLRATPYDTERGIGSDTGVARHVSSPSSSDPLVLGNSNRLSTLADLDLDGDLDLLLSNGDLFSQIHPGEFEKQSTLAATGKVIAGDLNGDGKNDLAQLSGSSIKIFYQVGPISFSQGIDLLLDSNPLNFIYQEIIGSDLNSDGLLDLAVNGNKDKQIFFQRPGQPDSGRFAVGQSLTVNVPDLSIAAADMNNDGAVDLLSTDSLGVKVFFQKTTSPDLSKFAQSPSVELPGGGHLVQAADLDLDGIFDVVIARRDDNVLFNSVLVLTAASEFQITSIQIDTILINDLVLEDLNGDELTDILTANDPLSRGEFIDSGNLTCIIQVKNGQFSNDHLVLFPESKSSQQNNFFRSILAGDINGDGEIDLAASARDSINIFLKTGAGRLPLQKSIVGGDFKTIWPVSIGATDFSGDGTFDLVSFNFDNSPSTKTTAFSQRTPGFFDKEPIHFAAGGSIFLADLDSDGDIDIGCGNSLFQQRPDGSFGSYQIILDDSSPVFDIFASKNVVGDFNNDGRVDVVAGGSIYLQSIRNGEVFFEKNQLPLPPFTTSKAASAGDLNADGNLDLLIGFYLLFQQKPLEFSRLDLNAPGINGFVTSSLLDDIDRDGRIDALIGDGGDIKDGQIIIFFQDEGGQFISPSLILQAGEGRGFAAADFNQDGLLDIVSGSKVFFQTRPREFERTVIYQKERSNPTEVLARDMDGDGDVDLVVPSRANGDIAIFYTSQ